MSNDKGLTVILPIELTNENYGQSKFWAKTHKARQMFELILKQDYKRTPFDVPVTVTVTRILGKGQKLWDSSSGLRGNYKQLEDTLVSLGWFHDDSPKWITETRFKQDTTRREIGPAVQIDITPVKDSCCP